MRAYNFLIVGIPMGRSSEIKAGKDNSVPRSILIFSLANIDMAIGDIKNKMIILIGTL